MEYECYDPISLIFKIIYVYEHICIYLEIFEFLLLMVVCSHFPPTFLLVFFCYLYQLLGHRLCNYVLQACFVFCL
jgi:hypothetical protein